MHTFRNKILSFCLVFLISFIPSCGPSQIELSATDTSILESLPEGWQLYKIGNFSIGMAPGWTNYDPGYSLGMKYYETVGFNLPNGATLFIGEEDVGVCGLGIGWDPKDILKRLEDISTAKGWIDDQIDIRIIASGEWLDGTHKGYFVETFTSPYYSLPEKYTVRIIALASGEVDRTIEAVYVREGTSNITDEERELLKSAIASVNITFEE